MLLSLLMNTRHCERSVAIQGSWIATACGLAMTSHVGRSECS